MNRSIIIRLSVPFIALMTLCLTSCSKSSFYGTYVSEENAKDYTELKSDGAFFVQQASNSTSGKYKVDGKNITLIFEGGTTATGTIDGNTIIDNEGSHWTKRSREGAQVPPATLAVKTTLARVLEQELAQFHAATGVFVKNLATKEEAGVRADQLFNSVSVIKLAIMVRAYQLSDQGLLNLDEHVEIRESDRRPGTGILYTFDSGMKVTVRDLITQMIMTSDNTATDMVLERVGGLKVLNSWLRDSGFGETRMVQTMLEWFRQPLLAHNARYQSLSPEQIFAYWMYPYEISIPRLKADAADDTKLQKEVTYAVVASKFNGLWSTNRDYWVGSMTARETARMLEGIEMGTLASKESSEQMKRILLEQRAGQLRIPHYLACNVGHKTGDCPPVIANDVGIIYTSGGPIIISFFSASNTTPYAEHEDRIGSLARAVVRYFSKQE